MKTFTVHLRRGGLDPDRDIAVIKEGFCWPAVAFSVIWAVLHRLWLVALSFLAAEVALSALLGWLGADVKTELALSLGLAVVIGLIANDLRRWTLERHGFVERDVVAASDADAAERRFYERNPRLAAELAHALSSLAAAPGAAR